MFEANESKEYSFEESHAMIRSKHKFKRIFSAAERQWEIYCFGKPPVISAISFITYLIKQLT